LNRSITSPQGTYGNILEILETHLVLMDLSPELAETIIRIAEIRGASFERVDRLVERALFSAKPTMENAGKRGGIKNADKED